MVRSTANGVHWPTILTFECLYIARSSLNIVETTMFMGPSIYLKWPTFERGETQAATCIKYNKLTDMHRDFGGPTECSCPGLQEGYVGIARKVF